MSSLHKAVAAVIESVGLEAHYGRGPLEVTLPHTVWTLDVFPEGDTGGCRSEVSLTLEHVARATGGVSGIAQVQSTAASFDLALQRAHIVGATGSSSLVVRAGRSRVPDVDDEGVERLRCEYTFTWIDSL